MAARAAASIEKETGEKVELIEGAGGIFDVAVDGKIIFSKHQVYRFPESGELVQLIKNL